MVVPTSTSTALVDVQALSVLRQLAAPSPEELAHKAIRTTLRKISIEGALNILKAFNYDKDGFYYKGDYWMVKDLANDRYFPECQGRLACETVVILFWGGPPNRLGYYQGTLATLLADRVLHEIQERGVQEVARWIGTDERRDNAPNC